MALADRFWPKVDRRAPDECWPWLAAVGTHGYGAIRDDRGRVVTAQRAALIVDGRDPGPLYALHSCDNPLCVNPRHLRPGTHAANVRDAVARGRHRVGTAKLTAELAAQVRAHVAAGKMQRDVAAEFGVSQPAVSEIITGKRWKPAAARA